MPQSTVTRVRVAALILSCVGLALAASSAPLAAQTAAGASLVAAREAPSDALLRHVRRLASSPRDFDALIGAGKAALEVGDVKAAIGFFGRADEVHPASPLPKAGMGAALVAEGDAGDALPYFTRAQQLGANGSMIGCDRGLAFDLLGRHGEAQADYRAALFGADSDEARRRLALSLAITGDKNGALDQLAPLSARGDPAASRVRALVLALTGDADNARRVLDTRMPGVSAAMEPFFRRLPALGSSEKAAAVHLGIFPGGAQQGYAAIATQGPVQPAARQDTATRVATIDQWLSQSGSPTVASVTPAPQAARPAQVANPPVQMASINPKSQQRMDITAIVSAGAVSTYAQERVWLQLASGKNSEALPDQFRRIKSRAAESLEGISGFVAEGSDRSRLLIGPFKNKADADLFAEGLAEERVNAFAWTSPRGQSLRKLAE